MSNINEQALQFPPSQQIRIMQTDPAQPLTMLILTRTRMRQKQVPLTVHHLKKKEKEKNTRF